MIRKLLMLGLLMSPLLLGGCGQRVSQAPNTVINIPPMLNDGINTGSLAQGGLAAEHIEPLLKKLNSQHYQQIHSLLVYKNDLLVIEEYFVGNDDYIDFDHNVSRVASPSPVQWTRGAKHYVASVNKALTATLTGIALAQSGQDVTVKMATLLPQYQAYFNQPNTAQLSIKDVLTMQMGFEWDEWGSNDLALLWQSTDFAQFVLQRPNTGPGRRWTYNSAGPNLMLTGLQNLLNQPLGQWADQHFYRRLGITDYQWQTQPSGLPEGSARMFMRPRDMLKVGMTYLHSGQWQGEQVIPKAWVDAIFTPQASSDAGRYSYYFWHRTLNGIDYISADGDGGQYINIFPQQNMVIVMTQGNYLQWPMYADQAADIMANYIFPAL